MMEFAGLTVPPGVNLEADTDDGVAFLVADARHIAAGAMPALAADGIRRWLALSPFTPYWLAPSVGFGASGVPADTQYLLWECADGTFGVMLPLVDGDVRATMRGAEDRLVVALEGHDPAAPQDRATAACVAWGGDPYETTRRAAAASADRLRTFRVREQKAEPDFVDMIGWCTWNAYGHGVTADKVLDGVASFADAGFPLGYVILDDGWLDTEAGRLRSFEADPDSVPGGLAPLIRRCKSEYGLRLFAVWHAFGGYWLGVSPDGPLGARYRAVHNSGTVRPWQGPDEEPLRFVDPADIGTFYMDYYRELRRAGVDMVKVDEQGVVPFVAKGKLGRGGTMRAYQEALQAAAQVRMRGRVINCMCNLNDVACHMDSSLVWRNSEDYFPTKPLESTQLHVYMNALNNMWSSTFALPDWDMFQTHRATGAFHAAARAVSGGPVYVTDEPGRQDFDVLRKLVTSDGRVLRCDRPALPARDCLFVDCHAEPRLLKITNRAGSAGVLGLFHCQAAGGPITGSFRPSDVPDLEGERFAAWLHNGRRIAILHANDSCPVTLTAGDFELVTIAPVADGLAAFGLLDKFNGAAAVESSDCLGGGRTRVRLRDGGEVGFQCASEPVGVQVNGCRANARYRREDGLLVVEAPAGGPVVVDVTVEGSAPPRSP